MIKIFFFGGGKKELGDDEETMGANSLTKVTLGRSALTA